MKTDRISFGMGYKELHTVVRAPVPEVIKALDNARPYLKQIGNSMPYPRDLVITVKDNGCDTLLIAYDVNNKTKKARQLAVKNEHNMTEHGLDFVQSVFEGIELYSKKDFKEVACDFVKRLYRVQEDLHPIKFPKLAEYPYEDCEHPSCC